jgi:hypothetical protein
MAANLKSPFPSPSLGFVDSQGRINRVWLEFLLTQFRRTGSELGGDLGALTALVNAHTERLDTLDGEVADLQLLVESNPFGAAIAAVLGRMAVLEMMVASMPVANATSASVAMLPEPVAALHAVQTNLPEPVAVQRAASDDLRKLIEA